MKFSRQDVLKKHRFRRLWVGGLTIALLGQVAWGAQAESAKQIEIRNEKILRGHYAAAQKYETEHQFAAAAQQYRIFLADALGELAIAQAHGDEYKKAAANFDAALSLAPNSPALLVEYSEAALRAGKLAKAEKLSRQIIQRYPKNSNAKARAYSVLGRALLKRHNSAGARKALKSAYDLNPDFPNGYDLAVACLNQEDQKCAAKIFDGMKAKYANKALLHMYFGQAYMASDFQSKAVEEFKEAIAEDSKLPGAHYSLAAAYLVAHQNVGAAKTELQKETALYPKEAIAHAALGHLEANQHNYTAAEKELKLAVALAPEDPDAYLYLGQLYVGLNQKAKAIDALRKSIRFTKDVTRNHGQVQQAHFLLGRLLLQSGDRAAGQKEMKLAQSLANKSLSRARERLAAYYGEDQDKQGETHVLAAHVPAAVRQAVEAAAQAADNFEQSMVPSIANSYNNLGAIAGMQGDQQTAFENFLHAKQWSPEMPGLDENLGRAAYSSLHFAYAVAPLTRYVKAHPGNVTIRAALGISLYMTNDYAKALTALKPVMQSGKATDEVAYIYAECMVKTGQTREGIARLKALTEKLPNNANLRLALGEAYLAAGHMSEAIAELQAVEKLNGKDSLVHLDLAKAYKKAGRQKDAAREMQEYESLANKDNDKN